MEQLGGMDAMMLFAETPSMHLHVCGLLILDTSTMPNGYCYEALHDIFVERLPSIPSVRQKLARVPLNLSRPFWIEDPDFDIDRHLHRVGVRPPGDDRALAEMVGDIASQPLSRDRPLWEMWVVEGLADGRMAVVAKMHHSTIDGVSGASMMGELFDLEPTGTSVREAMGQRPPGTADGSSSPTAAGAGIGRTADAPSGLELFGRGVATRLAQPWQLAMLVPQTAVRIGSTFWKLTRAGLPAVPAAKPFTAPRTSFNAAITARRSVAFVDVSLDDIKQVKKAFGATVNDVVTTVVGGALRNYLERRGELPEEPLVAATPVSVHDQTADQAGMTRVSVMFSSLATHVKDPAERLKTVAAANARAKEIHRMVGADTLLRWSEQMWPNVFTLGARLYFGLNMAERHPVVHNLILSNVPGPPIPLYIAGARLAGLYPLGPIMDGAGVNVTVLSEEDRVGVGIITCPQLVPRVWDMAAEVPPALHELMDVAGSG